jgi:hypothetical protein
MFGYVRIEKDELKMRDYHLVRAHYCGLCKTLAKEYGPFARFALSYDLTFLAVLLGALDAENPAVMPRGCLANPFVKKPEVQKNAILQYCAAANVALAFEKTRDDLRDGHSAKGLFGAALLYFPYRGAKKRFPKAVAAMREGLGALLLLEKSACALPDLPADAFGSVLAAVFSGYYEDERQNRVLAQIGRDVGRAAYLFDAWEDRGKDAQKKNYNPFLLAKTDAADAKPALEYELSQIARSFALLEIKRNREILENILFLGMRRALDKIFSELV